MLYAYIALGFIVFGFPLAFDLYYMALQRKIVREHQKEWDAIKAELEEKGANHIEIAEAYERYIESCGGCFPCM